MLQITERSANAMTPAKHIVQLIVLTLLTLACAATPPSATIAPPLTPEEVVALFHETYGTADMDDIGPYTTGRFRGERPITVWIIDTWDNLSELEYELIQYKILESQMNEKKNEAQVECASKIKTQPGTFVQKEIFILVLEGGEWLIDELYVTNEMVTGEDTKL